MVSANDGVLVQEFVYDVAVDGGALGEKALHAKANSAVIPVGAIIRQVVAHVVTACTSTGSATVVWGNGNDKDGYSGTLIAVATLADNYVNNAWENGSVLLWDNTDDHPIYINVLDAAAGQFIVTVATEVLATGKIIFAVEYYMPSLA